MVSGTGSGVRLVVCFSVIIIRLVCLCNEGNHMNYRETDRAASATIPATIPATLHSYKHFLLATLFGPARLVKIPTTSVTFKVNVNGKIINVNVLTKRSCSQSSIFIV